MRTKEIAGALIFIVFAVVYGFLTSGLSVRTLPNTPGSSFMPWCITICLLTLSTIWLGQSVISKRIPGHGEKSAQAKTSWKTASIGLLAFLIYLTLLPFVGFLISTPPFFGILMSIFGEKRPGRLCICSVVLPLAFYLVFKILFQIPLPSSGLIG